jgi:WD40 repeat protein
MAFSPNGQLLASGGCPWPVLPTEVWDLRDGNRSLLTAPLVGGFERKLDFSPDSSLLACGGAEPRITQGPLTYSVRTYDVRSGKQVHRFTIEAPPRWLRFHPLENRLAIAVDRQLRIVDLDGHAVMAPIAHPGKVLCANWSADGTILVSCADARAHIWNATTGEPLAVCEGDETMIHAAFSHDGELLVSSSPDDTTYIWDPRTGKELYRTGGTGGEFSQDDRWLGFGVFGPGVGRWEVISGGEWRTLYNRELQTGLQALSINPQGTLLACAGLNGVSLWDLKTLRLLDTVAKGQTWSAAFDPSGHSLITSGTSAGFCRWPLKYDPDALPPRLEVKAATLLLPPGSSSLPRSAALTRDFKTAVVSTDGSRMLIVDMDQAPRREPAVLNVFGSYMDISPDGQWVATSPMDIAGAKLWDAKTRKQVKDFPGIAGARVSFSPDNRWLIFATPQEYVFFHVGTWEAGPRVARDYAGHTTGPIAFSRDNKIIALTPTARLIRLIESVNGHELATLTAPAAEQITALCFTPDGARLAAGTAKGQMQLWDLRRCREQLRAMGIDWDEPSSATPR